jgi:hypothetical protein
LFAESNYTFDISTSVPSIDLSYGNGTFNYGNLVFNHTLNYTIVSPNLDSCWLEYNNINLSIPCTSNSLNTTTFQLIRDNYEATIYVNDTLGNLGSESFSWSYRVFENNRTFSPSSTITTIEEFKLNITTDGTQTPLIYLDYNDSQKLTTLSGGEYKTNLTINDLGNNTIHWNITYGSNNFNTYSSYQEVNDLTSLTIVDGSCPAGLSKVMNFTFFDESNLTSLSNMKVKYNFKYGVSNATGATQFGSINATEFSLCLNTTQSPTYQFGYGEIEYSKTDYSSRRYYVFDNTRVSNVTTYIPLYSLPNFQSTSFLIEIREPTLTPFVNKYTTLLKWYPNLNEYKVVEMGKTDDKGQTVKKVKVEDVDYRVGVYETDGTLIYLANPIRMVCLASPCTYSLTVRESESYTFDDLYNIQADIVYSGGIFTLTYNDPSQNTELMELKIYRIGGMASDVEICSSNSSSFTGIITCDVSSETGILKAVAYRSASPEYSLLSKIIDTEITVFTGNFGLFIQFMLSVVLIFAGIVSPITAIVLGLVSLVFGVFLFKTITYPIFIGIAILAGLVIHFMRRST